MDWTYINTLLSVIHQAAAAGPKFAPVAAAANDELWAHFNTPAEPAQETEDE